ncbi:MAG: 4-hydroxy-3-methylbut-2-enyl diphosphate reductase [Treponema sp.]|nr:4-hydroxy-3-methylbut-2-enyl diphosphate reductase [Treponema sp.]
MKVIRAVSLGYCMGVRRAVSIAEAETGKKVYTIGPLIHNPRVLEDLRQRGIQALETAETSADLCEAVVIIRAHGVTPRQERQLAEQGARLVDATCLRVKASQMKAKALAESDHVVFLAGEKRHGELIGIQGYAPDCLLVADAGEAEASAAALHASVPASKTALLGQTTLSADEYGLIAQAIRRYFPDIEVIDTICRATRDRQNALKELCRLVDAIVVAGGRDSANTQRLFAIAQAAGKAAWLVESAAELPDALAAYPRVGLSAGASTPDKVIDEIEEALQQLGAAPSQP